jgi:hypothetical protein
MILDDRILEIRLKQQPEFMLRLHEVLVNWRLQEKPGLIVQARPTDSAVLDVMDVKVRSALRDGIETDDASSWWGNFEGSRVLHSLHGIAATANTDAPTWLTEAHRDGHMLAGVWDFPEVPLRDKQVSAIVEFYASFFIEAFKLMANVAGAGGLGGEFHATATLVSATMLRYAARNPSGYAGISGEPCLSQNVQWSVQSAHIGSAEWHTLAKTMGRGIAGAYRAPLR